MIKTKLKFMLAGVVMLASSLIQAAPIDYPLTISWPPYVNGADPAYDPLNYDVQVQCRFTTASVPFLDEVVSATNSKLTKATLINSGDTVVCKARPIRKNSTTSAFNTGGWSTESTRLFVEPSTFGVIFIN